MIEVAASCSSGEFRSSQIGLPDLKKPGIDQMSLASPEISGFQVVILPDVGNLPQILK
jgi:hypothetical protein